MTVAMSPCSRPGSIASSIAATGRMASIPPSSFSPK
jgi:hypothetical protein